MINQTEANKAEEKRIAAFVAEQWGVQFNEYADLDPLDWWIQKGNRTIGFSEIKRRHNASTKYPTVFLSLRKWFYLLHTSRATCRQGWFIVKFNDCVCHIEVGHVDAGNNCVAGRTDREGNPNDLEPIIHVPVSSMTRMD